MSGHNRHREARKDDEIAELLKALNDFDATIQAAGERALLEGLDGSCRTPIAAFGELCGNDFRIRAAIIRPDGSELLETERNGPISDAKVMGRDAAEELAGRASPGFSMNNKQRRKALITQPREDAAALAAALNLRGIPSVIAPMMQTEFLSEDIESDLVSAQAVLFTSRNGVRAFVRVSDRRDQQIYAVGTPPLRWQSKMASQTSKAQTVIAKILQLSLRIGCGRRMDL